MINSIKAEVQSHVLLGILCIHLGICELFKSVLTKYK